MAELAVIGFTMSCVANAAGTLGIIKRRCYAHKKIKTLIKDCDELVSYIKKLMEQIERCEHLAPSSQMILKRRSKKFKSVARSLEEMKQRSNDTLVTTQFLIAQEWAQKFESMQNTLEDVCRAVEMIAVNSESHHKSGAADDDLAVIDATLSSAIGELDMDSGSESGVVSVPTGNADRMLLPSVKLTNGDLRALDKHGGLGELLPNALFKAGSAYFQKSLDLWLANEIKPREADHCSRRAVRFWHLAADLHQPDAHDMLGDAYRDGFGVTRDTELSISHYKRAIDGGVSIAEVGLMQLYERQGNRKKKLKYARMAAENFYEQAIQHLVLDLTHGDSTDREAEEAREWLARSSSPYFKSFCYFNGIAVQRSKSKAQKLEVVDYNDVFRLGLVPHSDQLELEIDWDLEFPDDFWLLGELGIRHAAARNWIEFLFSSEHQSVALYLANNHWRVFHDRELKQYATRAANDGNIIGNLILAQNYSNSEHSKPHRVREHLRIAAAAGRSDAQSICRQKYSDKQRVSRGVKDSTDEKRGRRKRESGRAEKKNN